MTESQKDYERLMKESEDLEQLQKDLRDIVFKLSLHVAHRNQDDSNLSTKMMRQIRLFNLEEATDNLLHQLA